MTRELEKRIMFRCPEFLYDNLVKYSKKNGYKDISGLIRAVLIHHLMAVSLKEIPELSRNQMKKLIEKNIKKL